MENSEALNIDQNKYIYKHYTQVLFTVAGGESSLYKQKWRKHKNWEHEEDTRGKVRRMQRMSHWETDNLWGDPMKSSPRRYDLLVYRGTADMQPNRCSEIFVCALLSIFWSTNWRIASPIKIWGVAPWHDSRQSYVSYVMKGNCIVLKTTKKGNTWIYIREVTPLKDISVASWEQK